MLASAFLRGDFSYFLEKYYFLNPKLTQAPGLQKFPFIFHLQSVLQSVGTSPKTPKAARMNTHTQTHTHTHPTPLSGGKSAFYRPKSAVQIQQVEIGFINMSMTAIFYLNPSC